MIVLFTDFGTDGPYIGQVKAVLVKSAPEVPIIDLLHEAPACDPELSAYLLAALADRMPKNAVFVCVVDPGVGGQRRALVIEADGRYFVGPDNGLLSIVTRRAKQVRLHEITWRPERISASFHGRDLFAPVAADLAVGRMPACRDAALDTLVGFDWPDDLPKVVFIDRFGNAMTGLRASVVGEGAMLLVAGRRLTSARTFGDVPAGQPFWYENANGLAEIAVNRGRADNVLGIRIGMDVERTAPTVD